jgi:CheY-like chemotaxis protein
LKRVLLVDDDEDDRDFFLSVLDVIDASLKCHTAENGSVALQYLIQQKVRPDVIFLDLNMPVMNGKQFLAEVKKRDDLKDIPVIVLSTKLRPHHDI